MARRLPAARVSRSPFASRLTSSYPSISRTAARSPSRPLGAAIAQAPVLSPKSSSGGGGSDVDLKVLEASDRNAGRRQIAEAAAIRRDPIDRRILHEGRIVRLAARSSARYAQ